MTRRRAAAGRAGCCVLALIIAGLTRFEVVLPAAVAGETEPDEIPIGTFQVGPRAEAARGDEAHSSAPTHGAPQEFAKPSSPHTAIGGLYEDAVMALNSGRRAEAQRLFERLIAEAPDSAAAGQARGHLAALYRNSQVGSVVKEYRAAADSALAEETDDKRSVAVSAALEERFIVEAGDRVFFSVGSAELGSRARGVLKAQAKFIKLRPDLSATIEGHADDAPLSSEEHGRLSEARGEAVRQRLIEEGVESHRLAVVSWGRSRRVANCTDAACAAQNRRAVTVLQNVWPRNSNGPAGFAPGTPALVSGQPEQLTH